MSEPRQERRGGEWNIEERRAILTALENMRLSSDSTLKAIPELKTQIELLSLTVKHQDEKINALNERLDESKKWLQGLAAGITLFLIAQGWSLFAKVSALLNVKGM